MMLGLRMEGENQQQKINQLNPDGKVITWMDFLTVSNALRVLKPYADNIVMHIQNDYIIQKDYEELFFTHFPLFYTIDFF
jgi:hypothetical protein